MTGFGWSFLDKVKIDWTLLVPVWLETWKTLLFSQLSLYPTLCMLELLPSPVCRIRELWLQDLAAGYRREPAKCAKFGARVNSNSKCWPCGQGMWREASHSGSIYSPKALKHQEGLLGSHRWLSLSSWLCLYIFGIQEQHCSSLLCVNVCGAFGRCGSSWSWPKASHCCCESEFLP